LEGAAGGDHLLQRLLTSLLWHALQCRDGKASRFFIDGKGCRSERKKKKAGLLADQHHHPVQSEAEEEAAQQPAETFSNRQS